MKTAILAVFLFLVMIFPHELGHFIAAKKCNVQVNEFAFGMGPVIWKKQRGETLHSIRLFPIGGFCAMEGEDGTEDDEEETDPETGLTTVEQRNKFSVGDTIEIFGPHTPYYEEVITEMYDEEGSPVQSAPHPQQILKIRFRRTPGRDFIMRKKKDQ